jgi:hypothetical protein
MTNESSLAKRTFGKSLTLGTLNSDRKYQSWLTTAALTLNGNDTLVQLLSLSAVSNQSLPWASLGGALPLLTGPR